MPNIAQVLKAEICRLAKKEAKALTSKLTKDVVRLKKANVAMRRCVAQLKRDNDLLMASEKRRQQSQPVAPLTAGRARLTAKGVRAMRKKLGLSQAEFGRLVGVSTVSVGNWEKKDGPLRLKAGTRAAVLALRGLGAREAKRRLEMVVVKKAVRKAKAKGKRGRGVARKGGRK